MNASASPEAPGTAAEAFVAVTAPVLVALGSVGNFLTMLVTAIDRNIKDTTRLLFFLLALFDQLSLMLSEVRLWILAVERRDIRGTHAVPCHLHIFFGHVTFYMSTWLLFLTCLERFCLVFCPLKRHCFRQKRFIGAVVVAILLGIAGMNSLFLFNSLKNDVCGSVSALQLSLLLTFGYLLPFLLTLVLTALLMGRAFRPQHAVDHENAPSGGQARLRSVSKMLFGVVWAQVVLGMPGILFTIVGIAHGLGYIPPQRYKDIFTVLLTLTYANNAVNFYIYMLSARGFRNTFLSICSEMRHRLLSCCSTKEQS